MPLKERRYTGGLNLAYLHFALIFIFNDIRVHGVYYVVIGIGVDKRS